MIKLVVEPLPSKRLSSLGSSQQISGVGVCLRAPHYQQFLTNPPNVPWLEILADNYLGMSGIAWEKLQTICQNYPVVLHCVGFGFGNTDAIDWDYAKQVKELACALKPTWISDHLCWTAFENHHSHNLLPLPFTTEVINHSSQRVAEIQTYLDCPVLIENVASYTRTPFDDMSEMGFINQVAKQADCGILLDLNNLYVNAINHQENIQTMLAEVNAERVCQYHLAGYEYQGNLLLDTHGGLTREVVWQLYEQALQCIGQRPTCVEWDNNIPAWEVLSGETNKARTLFEEFA